MSSSLARASEAREREGNNWPLIINTRGKVEHTMEVEGFFSEGWSLDA